MIELGVHSVITDYKFRTSKLEFQDPDIYDCEEEPTIKIATENNIIKKQDLKHFKPRNLTEYLFSDCNGKLQAKVEGADLDKLCDKFIQPLIHLQEDLKAKFLELGKRAVTAVERAKLGNLLVNLIILF